ncbi:uncharacterized protein LOC130629963 [Hydractinia symbiolongicarpus]|uniref:uncharacterized protein LOC130629963 n=1 Tax=Hydractinia symbiolongicarpus TaxID=13093 RepID=UPI00254C9FE2|nr:uncharacterized protein LOC130629963 [Hydractinia symbiolongicarpus]
MKSIVNFVELQTLINEIELILNNRPICDKYDDDCEDVLTPNHLLYGRRMECSSLRSEEVIMDDSEFKGRKRMLQAMLDHFWKCWSQEYLCSLRQSVNHVSKGGVEKISEGDVVIVYDDKLTRHMWKLGRVVKLVPESDDKVRATQVKLGQTGTIVNRPVNRLYPLETKCGRPVIEKQTNEEVDEDEDENKISPQTNCGNSGGVKTTFRERRKLLASRGDC